MPVQMAKTFVKTTLELWSVESVVNCWNNDKLIPVTCLNKMYDFYWELT